LELPLNIQPTNLPQGDQEMINDDPIPPVQAEKVTFTPGNAAD
jgi:hypothetical protein